MANEHMYEDSTPDGAPGEDCARAGDRLLDLEKIVQDFRTKLLDLSRRNNLISMRRSTMQVPIVDELPNQVCDELLSGRRFVFRGIPVDEEGQPLFSKELELPTQPATAEDRLPQHSDDQLQTPFVEKKLDATLNKLRLRAKTEIEETGGSSLYLALGFLEWYEKDESDKQAFAPLWLIPVTLTRDQDRARGRYNYYLEHSGDDIQRNESLAEKLKLDFGLDLPQIEDDMTPEDYFDAVRNAVVSRRTWSVCREAKVGLFQFQKLYLYKDLDPVLWKALGGFERSQVLSDVLRGSGRDVDFEDRGQSYDIDDEPKYRDMPLPLNADSSQHSAIIDAANGTSFVLEGPPGTGKSQTITNLIAWSRTNRGTLAST